MPAARAIARPGEGTRMTDKDVEQFMGSQAVSDSLKRVYQRAVDGTMTAEDKKVMTDAINKMQDVEWVFLNKLEMTWQIDTDQLIKHWLLKACRFTICFRRTF